jgi:hypothetical protein
MSTIAGQQGIVIVVEKQTPGSNSKRERQGNWPVKGGDPDQLRKKLDPSMW